MPAWSRHSGDGVTHVQRLWFAHSSFCSSLPSSLSTQSRATFGQHRWDSFFLRFKNVLPFPVRQAWDCVTAHIPHCANSLASRSLGFLHTKRRRQHTSQGRVRVTGMCVVPKHGTWHGAGEGPVPSWPRPGGPSQQLPTRASPRRIAPVLKLFTVRAFPFSYLPCALEDFDPKLHVLSHY